MLRPPVVSQRLGWQGGQLCIKGAVAMAERLHLSEKFIGCTILAAGTSLPELATSAVAAYRRHSDIAIGNIIGSNIFNILAILGVSVTIRPAAYPPLFNIDMCFLIAGTVFLFVVMFLGTRRKLDRWQAVLMLIGYCAYTAYLLHCR